MRIVIKYSPKEILYRWSTKYMFWKNTKNANEMSLMKFFFIKAAESRSIY